MKKKISKAFRELAKEIEKNNSSDYICFELDRKYSNDNYLAFERINSPYRLAYLGIFYDDAKEELGKKRLNNLGFWRHEESIDVCNYRKATLSQKRKTNSMRILSLLIAAEWLESMGK